MVLLIFTVFTTSYPSAELDYGLLERRTPPPLGERSDIDYANFISNESKLTFINII